MTDAFDTQKITAMIVLDKILTSKKSALLNEENKGMRSSVPIKDMTAYIHWRYNEEDDE